MRGDGKGGENCREHMVETQDAVYWLKACLLGIYPLINSHDSRNIAHIAREICFQSSVFNVMVFIFN